jgi:hypothetical protein
MLPFKIDGEIKSFQDKHKQKQFTRVQPSLQMIKRILHTKEEERNSSSQKLGKQ